jgi:hypothetical protein
MNIFYLHEEPKKAAELHNDKHVVKMILEYGQLMSTAHRVLDGVVYYGKTANGRKIRRWLLPDDREQVLWKASHILHPSGVWTRASNQNYNWLYSLWSNLLEEYTYRYGKHHSAERMKNYFYSLPNNIPIGPFTQPTPAMPDQYKITGDSLRSYINYYVGAKQHLASWKKREKPEWFNYA